MTQAATSRLRRVLRQSITLSLTLTVLVGAGLAVVGGRSVLSGSAAVTEEGSAPLTAVAVMRVEPQSGYGITRRFTGQIEAPANAELGFELGGRLAEVLVQEGDAIAAGTVVARLDTAALIPERAALQAELAALAADAELAQLTLARNDALSERGFRSVAAQDEARLSLARARAGMEAIRARIAGVDVRLDKSVLTAPFDAVIGARLVDAGQTVAAGQPVLALFQDAAPRLRVGLPPDLAAELQVGAPARIEVGGLLRPATILYIRPDLDPGTRSRSVVLSLPKGLAQGLGETASLVLETQVDEPGFWAPLSALREGVRGSWSVVAVETTGQGDRTVTAGVEVIHTDGTRVYLRGTLPAGARIVAEGPDRVAPGQRVATLTE
jgi:membrane fusion protein, multidrug efflux system